MIPLSAIKKKIAWRETAPSILLVLNSFVWYVITYLVFSIIVNELEWLKMEKLSLFTAYFLGIATSSIIGSKFFPRARVKFLYLWLLMGTVATLLLITVSSNGMLANVLFAFFLGVSIGIGLPSCLSYFADSTSIENRGLVGGIIWSGVGFVVLFFVVLVNTLGRWETIVTLTIWRIFGCFSFLFLTRHHEKSSVQKSPSYLELVRKKDILLYLFPWVMFSLINFSEAPLLERVFGPEFFAFTEFAEYVFAGIFASVGGILADIVGRKRVVIMGFVMLGIEYATLSVFFGSPAALYLFMTFDGITWGLFFSVFFMSIWGDLGEGYEREKYYTLGGLPFLLANFVSILISPYASDISPTAAFSLASFFLFLAVVPLMFAPETLPEKAIRERELKQYIEKAKKVKEKFT
jgi:MFS family permease